MEEQVSRLEDAPTPILKRSQLIKSTGEWSTIETVAMAVSVATEFQTKVYVERLGDRYRWSLIHRGGPNPLLRITAKYLQVDYNSIIVGCREVGDGWSGEELEDWSARLAVDKGRRAVRQVSGASS